LLKAHLVVFGIIYQAIASCCKIPPTGQLIDINGIHLHYQVMGEGNPTVIFNNGQGKTYLDWELVKLEEAI
jgi:hypothetical protein